MLPFVLYRCRGLLINFFHTCPDPGAGCVGCASVSFQGAVVKEEGQLPRPPQPPTPPPPLQCVSALGPGGQSW